MLTTYITVKKKKKNRKSHIVLQYYFTIFLFFVCPSEFFDVQFVKQLSQEKKMCLNVKIVNLLEAADLQDSGNLVQKLLGMSSAHESWEREEIWLCH